MASKLKVRFRGKVYELPGICWSEEKAAETLARWDEGVIELERIYEHESPSTLDERSLIVERTLKRAGVRLRITGEKLPAIAIRDAFKALPPES